jgi:hypothetical protein
MSNLTETIAAESERDAVAKWALRRKRAIQGGALGSVPGDFVQGYEAALDDLKYLLVKREQDA